MYFDPGIINHSLTVFRHLFLTLRIELISHEDIVTELAGDTLDNGAGLGVGGGTFSPGSYSQVACLTLKVKFLVYTQGRALLLINIAMW